MSAGDPDLRSLFAAEAAGQLDRLGDGALALERGAADPELVAALFRDAHTLKSSSALVGLPEISAVAHALEDVLGELRAGRRPADAEVVQAILDATDRIRALMAGDRPAGEPAATAPAEDPEPASGDDTITVALDRLDRLVRTSGEAGALLLRLRAQVRGALAADPEAESTLVALERSLGVLRDQALGARMTSFAAIAAPLRRAVRDVATARGRTIDLDLDGERVQIDRAILDALREPLLHLVRNAADHGIEDPRDRRAAGKPEAGTIRLRAVRRGPEIVITVRDDGAGLDLDALRAAAGAPDLDDAQAAELVFRPGLSTAAALSDVSGRGVGLDAVRVGVEALRGRVRVSSERGVGTTFRIVVPVTLAVLPCVVVEAGGETYALPTHATVALVEEPAAARVGLEGGTAVWVGGEIVPLVELTAIVGGTGTGSGPALVLGVGDRGRCALRLDAVHGQRDITVSELGAVLPRSALVAGASIEPDGSVLLVLDPIAIGERMRRAGGPPPAAPADAGPGAASAAPAAHAPSVLVVDDALTVRELQRSILTRAGYEVRTAVDGRDALALLAEERPDLVVTDVEMPGLDGLGLTRAIRATPALASVPVLMVTSRASPEDRRLGLEAGADAYLVKQDFDERRLLDAVGRLLGEHP